jgi:hypothetical protein
MKDESRNRDFKQLAVQCSVGNERSGERKRGAWKKKHEKNFMGHFSCCDARYLY